jgi:hypothetical protein
LEGQDDGALEEIVMLLCDLQEGSDGESQSSLERREEERTWWETKRNCGILKTKLSATIFENAMSKVL